MSLNRVMMIGNLGHDPEIRYTPSGLPLVNFSVAIDESYLDKEGKRQERVVWHRIVAAGKLALVCNEYLKKRQAGVCRRTTSLCGMGEQLRRPQTTSRRSRRGSRAIPGFAVSR